MTITIYDVAKHVGCSHTTVSRVLNGKAQDFISEVTRQKVLTAVIDLGYRPNRKMRAQTDNNREFIGLWGPDLQSPYFTEMMHSLSIVLAKHGYETLVLTTDCDPMVHLLPLKGLIALGTLPFVVNLLEHNGQYQTPIVSIDAKPITGIDSITIDFEAGVKQAVEYLVADGRKRIAILISTLQNIQGDSRRDAFADAMQTAGLPLEVIEIEIGNEALEGVKETVKKYITLHGVPDGIFCTSDFNAVPAHRAIREMGLRMPEDIALIGFDGTDICKYLDPQLSTVAVPRDKICKKACDMLLARIKQPNKKAHTVKIVPALELRESAKKVQPSPDKSDIPLESE